MGRSKSSIAGVTRRAALLGFVTLSACLNPMPDDFPNDHDTTIDVGPVPVAVPGAAGGSTGVGSGESGTPQDLEPGVSTPPEDTAAEAPPSEADAGVTSDAGPGDSSGRR